MFKVKSFKKRFSNYSAEPSEFRREASGACLGERRVRSGASASLNLTSATAPAMSPTGLHSRFHWKNGLQCRTVKRPCVALLPCFANDSL